MTRRRGWPLARSPSSLVLPLLVLLLLPGLLPAGVASAQEAQGTISGTVRIGTAGATATAEMRVELITVTPDGGLTAQQTTTRDGRFEFTVPVDASATHLVRAMHRGVQYFAPAPVLLSAELPRAEREITVYETTDETSGLRIDATVFTVVALDRGNAQMTIVREDMIANRGDRTYTGDGAGVSLRLPLPGNVVEADGSVVEAEGLPGVSAFTLEGDALAASAAFKPGVTLVVTRYLVGYDRDRDAYRLDMQAPLPTGRIELRTPARFVSEVRPLDGSRRGEERQLEDERVLVVERDGEIPAGAGAGAELRGLSGLRPGGGSNPLTARGGAALGAVLTLLALAGGFALTRRLAGRRAPGGDAG